MKIEQVAAQTYTIREFTKTPGEIRRSLRKLKEIGYGAIQASAMGPIPPIDLKRLCRENGLTICAAHEPSNQILDDPQSVIEKMQALECDIVAYPFPRDIDFGSEESVNELIEKLRNAGKAMAAEGIALSYHNHHQEFRKLGGKLILEKIMEGVPADCLSFEIDTYWVQYGGCDPVRWCAELEGRLPAIHLKDYRITDENKIDFAEVGEGNLDFKAIISAAESSGCRWFIVEQDTCPGDPFDSLAHSFDYIRDNLCD